MKFKRIRVGIECGQRWWRLSSWRLRGDRMFRTFPGGFAFGPIIVWTEPFAR